MSSKRRSNSGAPGARRGRGDALGAASAASPEQAALKLARAVAIPTVSHADYSLIDRAAHRRFRAFLRTSFPLVHRNLSLRAIGDFGLVYYWQGADPALKPFLLAAHFDVVPADQGPGGQWTHPPFSGHIDDTYVWGRGALDIKNSLVAILEAAEALLASGYEPARGMYFAFGGDEEIDGREGAAKIAAYLSESGVDLEYVLDEGTVIVTGMFSSCAPSMALVSIAEKGHCNLDLTVADTGGHSSLPGRHTAVGVLCGAVARLEKRPFPARLTPALELFLRGLAKQAPPCLRPVLARPRIFWPVLRYALSRNSNSDALVRTSQAVTMIRGSDKENVLPGSALATVNVRVLPGETVESVTSRIARVINDPRVKVTLNPRWLPNNPVSASATGSFGYRMISRTVSEIAPGTPVLPFLMGGSTDSKHYTLLTDCIYRFTPVFLDEEELKKIHGVDERISKENIRRCLDFFYRLIVNSSS